MQSTVRYWNAALLATASLHASAAGAVVLGQLDTFEDGTTMGWAMGVNAPTAVANISTGGPTGAGDSFIQIVADGGGASGRMTAFNNTQWRGDYPAAGITGIRMDLRNLGATDLTLRLGFRASTGPSAATGFSTAPVVLPAAGAWTTVLFPISNGALTFEDGGTATILTNPLDLRLFHATAAAYPGPFITAVLGVDNIQAIPEPSVWAQLIAGAMVLFGWTMWHRRTANMPCR